MLKLPALSPMFKLSSPTIAVATAFLSLPFKPKLSVASPDLKLYAFLTCFGAKALNKIGNGTLSALILISATDFSLILLHF